MVTTRFADTCLLFWHICAANSLSYKTGNLISCCRGCPNDKAHASAGGCGTDPEADHCPSHYLTSAQRLAHQIFGPNLVFGANE